MLQWTITPQADPAWLRTPVVAHSQLGYAPDAIKVATVELDPRDSRRPALKLLRVGVDGAHLKLNLEQSGSRFDALAFGRGEQMPASGTTVNIAFRPEYNHFRGRVSVQLRIKDFKLGAV